MSKMLSSSMDAACLDIMDLSNEWISTNQDLERVLRSGWLGLAETRRQLGFAFTTATQLDERDSQPLLTIQEDTLQLQSHPTAKAPLLFGALPPRSAKAAAADFRKAVELSARLLQIRRDLEGAHKALSSLRQKAATEQSEE